ncbi:MAG: type II and III secretion system protein family protein [Planctomycetota bacterium]
MSAIRFPARSLLAVSLMLGMASTGFGQTVEGTSPTFFINNGRNELTLIERFSSFVQHSSKISRVSDFDVEVLTVQPVDGDPSQIRIYALKPGVTTLTILDEHGEAFSVEILVRGDVRHLEAVLRREYPNDSIAVEEIGDAAVRLHGWVTEPSSVAQIQAIAEQHYPTVLNHMKTGGVQQVFLKCTILEVQRNKLRRLGMNFTLARPNGFLTSTPGPITPLTGIVGNTPTVGGLAGTSIAYGFTQQNTAFNGFVDAMRVEGLLKSHISPMIVTHNGRPANFLSGGEMPIPVSAGLGTTGIEFREFGIQMDAVPYVLGPGRVRLEVSTTVRDRDYANSVTVNGSTTPAFKTNSANTQVEMNFGEALVIAGLVSQREVNNGQKLPFFGELPYIGAAFRRTSSEESETELVILITPEYVAPAPASQFSHGGPGTMTDTPVDRELFGHGLMEVPKFGDECAFCPNCIASGDCRDPNCPHCRGDQCASSANRNGSGSKTVVAPAKKAATKAIPASATSDSKPKTQLPPAGSSKSTRTGSSGLISPTMR